MNSNHVTVRETVDGRPSIELSPTAIEIFEAVLEKLRQNGRPSLSERTLLVAYCVGWISGEIPAHTLPDDDDGLRLLSGILGDLSRQPRSSDHTSTTDRGGFGESEPLFAEATEVVRRDLRPRILARSLLQLRQWERQLRPLVAHSHWTPLGDHLAVQIVYNSAGGQGVVLLEEDLQRLELTPAAALQTAVENLRASSEAGSERLPSGLLAACWRDGWAPSRLLLPDLIHRAGVRGDMIAMALTPDELLLAGTEDECALLAMAQRTFELIGDRRLISGIPLRLSDNGVWRTFCPPCTFPAAEQFRQLRAMTYRREFDAQFYALRDVERVAGRDPFIGTLLVETRPGRSADSFAVWSNALSALLPRADLVGFWEQMNERQGRFYGLAPWERVLANLGHLTERVDAYPERFRVSAFPSPAQLRQLGLVDVDGTAMREPRIVEMPSELRELAEEAARRRAV